MEVDLGTTTQHAPLLLTTWAPATKDFGASSVSEVANSTASSGNSAIGVFADDALPSSGTLAEVSKELRIPLYILIFIADVLGNSLVIATLAQNKHMRTVTNMFLLNLAISDLLLGVFCMPFTLIGSVLREFIFGEAMCKIIPYVQAVSVAVSVWTLVAISLERFYAICEPLHSRRWQTLSHAWKTICVLWAASILCMLPIACLSQLLPTKSSGRLKCRENWPDDVSEKVFNIFLDCVLLVAPLAIMVGAYFRITTALWQGVGIEKDAPNNDVLLLEGFQGCNCNTTPSQLGYPQSKRTENYLCAPRNTYQDCANNSPVAVSIRWTKSGTNSTKIEYVVKKNTASRSAITNSLSESSGLLAMNHNHVVPVRQLIRSTHFEKSLTAKKRVVRMLFVVVLEFFICWTPLYVINTLALFDPGAVYGGLGSTGISFFHLLAYVSSCCNPITYCFMNKKFRHSFLQAFGCVKRIARTMSGNQSSTNGASFRNASYRQSICKTGILL